VISWGCALMMAFVVSVLAGSTYLLLLPAESTANWCVMPITIIIFLAALWCAGTPPVCYGKKGD